MSTANSASTTKSATPAAAMKNATTETSKVSTNAEVVEGKKITIDYDGERCIHARHCVLEASKVFLANTPGQWIHPDAMDVDDLVAVIERCPSGALSYQRKDAKPNETAPLVNAVFVHENGPLAFHADLRVNQEAVGWRRTLCRCGKSQQKPYCDNSHMAANFTATGMPTVGDQTSLKSRDGIVDVKPTRNGPNVVSGNLEICQGTGHRMQCVTSAAFCRCGSSGHKPFCDGSHVRVGFQARGV